MKNTILLIEDDPEVVDAVSRQITEYGYSVDIADEGEQGLSMAIANDYLTVIIDLGLPRIGGIEVCKRIRESGMKVPVIMLTARTDEVDRILGLEVGADDYVTKPFSVRELGARVQALIRRSHRERQSAAGDVRPGLLSRAGLEIDCEKRTVNRCGRMLELTATEFDLLYYLAANPGRVLTKSELLATVWGYSSAGYDTTLSTHISRLRAKVEPDSDHPVYIKTVWGIGYKFVER